MSQNSHNSGKICWNVLAESISHEISYIVRNYLAY